MVETAIILPVFVFTMLGLLQLGLMYHARLLTKYAAYKAVRAGALQRASKQHMEQAALAVLIPALGRASSSGAPMKTDTGVNLAIAYQTFRYNQQFGIPYVQVTICNPLKSQMNSNQDFDDPLVLNGQDPGWEDFNRTKLQIQVTTYYRLFVPFANWVIFRLAQGNEQSKQFDRMRWFAFDKDSRIKAPHLDREIITKLDGLAASRRYIMPLRASWGMRMQSNVLPDNDLPTGRAPAGTHDSSRYCLIPFARK